jgi:hypothetical protein
MAPVPAQRLPIAVQPAVIAESSRSIRRVTRAARRALTNMTRDEALDWIQQVDGRLYQNPRKANQNDEWVAVIRTPRSGRGRSKVIVASGKTLQQATAVAEAQWNELWEKLSRVH